VILELTTEEAKLMVHAASIGIAADRNFTSDEKNLLREILQKVKEASDEDSDADGAGGLDSE
jgi:hypothetical protein